jgi:pimeloyl-ACP methyl ester carboxylesterase
MPARLHHDLVAGDAPRAWALWTHGIYGSGGNWRTIARQVVARRPEWGVVLVDLRQHGRSEPGDPPHTIAACAGDLAALAGELTAAGRPVAAALGHSFGGKVVLALRPSLRPRSTWVLDSTPSARPGEWDAPDNSVREVWDSMGALDRSWARRDDFVAAMVARGHPLALAQWVAMNLVSGEDGYRLRLDLAAVRALLADYYVVDLWPAIEDPALPGDLHVVVAGRSSTVSVADRTRLAGLAAAGQVHVDTLDAGHWLHMEAPAAVIELVAAGLPSVP